MKDLPRPFIYRDRKDIDEFLDESELWNDIYNYFLQVKDNYYHLKVSAVTMFNEVRYQCVRVMLDKHPEESIWENYLNVAKDNLGWRYASDLCFVMVYAVFQLQKNRPKNVERFCRMLRLNIFAEEKLYLPYFCNLIDSYNELGKEKYETDFSPCPVSPEEFDREEFVLNSLGLNYSKVIYDCFWWQKKTEDFNQDKIREIVNLWTTPKDKLEVLNRIENAFDKYVNGPF